MDFDVTEVDAVLKFPLDHQLLERNPLGVSCHFTHEVDQSILLQGSGLKSNRHELFSE